MAAKVDKAVLATTTVSQLVVTHRELNRFIEHHTGLPYNSSLANGWSDQAAVWLKPGAENFTPKDSQVVEAWLKLSVEKVSKQPNKAPGALLILMWLRHVRRVALPAEFIVAVVL